MSSEAVERAQRWLDPERQTLPGDVSLMAHDVTSLAGEVASLTHQRDFWEQRYETQHRTLHKIEDALAAARAREQWLAELLGGARSHVEWSRDHIDNDADAVDAGVVLFEIDAALAADPAADERQANSKDRQTLGAATLAAESAAAGRGTRAFPHDFEGSGKRCLACGEPRWMHPSGSASAEDTAYQFAQRTGYLPRGSASAAADEPGEPE